VTRSQGLTERGPRRGAAGIVGINARLCWTVLFPSGRHPKAVHPVERLDPAFVAGLREAADQYNDCADDSGECPAAHSNSLNVASSYQSGSRLGGAAQEFSDAKMGQHDIGRPVQGLIVGPLEAVSFDGRVQQSVDFAQEMAYVLIGDVTGLVLEQMIHSDQQIGNRVQPGEPGIFLEQVEQDLGGGYGSAEALIRVLLSDDEGAVKLNQRLPH
jgi:hypothetical protein